MRTRTHVVGLLLLACIGCARDRLSETQGSTITVWHHANESVIGPHWNAAARLLVFLPIAAYDATGEVVPRLAERWEHSADYRRWTFFLRRDVRWHDGAPVTAHDMLFNFELWRNMSSPWYPSNMSYGSFELIDDFTFALTFDEPTDARDTWKVYFPKHLLEQLDPDQFWEWEFWSHPVGNGPYRYVRHVPETMLELEANPDFFEGEPRVQRVVLKFGQTNALVELLSGNVDVLPSVNSVDLLKVRDDPRFNVYFSVLPNFHWLEALVWNVESPPFDDVNVRRALTLAVDRVELRRMLNIPDEFPVFDVFFTARQYRRHELPAAIAYDPEEARRILAQAGWLDRDGDGVLDNGGSPFAFSALVAPGATQGPGLGAAAVYIQEMFRTIGVRMDIRNVDGAVVTDRLVSGDFEAVFTRIPNDPFTLSEFRGEGTTTSYADERMADLEKALAERGVVESEYTDSLVREAAGIVGRELPVLLLYPDVHAIVAHRRIRGLTSPFWSDPILSLFSLWIERDGTE